MARSARTSRADACVRETCRPAFGLTMAVSLEVQYPEGERSTTARRSVGVMAEHHHGPQSSSKAFFANWSTYDASFATKLRMAVSNTVVKLRHHQACCGNHGQPGC
jgi:hypothetical protein